MHTCGMDAPDAPVVREVIGVYDADGSLWGELRYVVGKLRGKHCALCDITHSAVGRRKGFAAIAGRLGVPFSLVHRDERSPDVVAHTGERTPLVIGRTDDGFVDLLLADDLAALDTSADALHDALVDALRAKGLRRAA